MPRCSRHRSSILLQLLCIQPCFLIDQPILATYDFLADILCPIFIIFLANVLLVVRIVCTRRYRPSFWRRQRKLAIQLFVFSMIYLIFWLPLTVNGLIITLTESEVSLQLQNDIFFFTIYFVPILLPLVFPSLLKNFRKTVFPCQRKRVVPLQPIFVTRLRWSLLILNQADYSCWNTFAVTKRFERYPTNHSWKRTDRIVLIKLKSIEIPSSSITRHASYLRAVSSVYDVHSPLELLNRGNHSLECWSIWRSFEIASLAQHAW